jgi:hypothetical protein
VLDPKDTKIVKDPVTGITTIKYVGDDVDSGMEVDEGEEAEEAEVAEEDVRKELGVDWGKVESAAVDEEEEIMVDRNTVPELAKTPSTTIPKLEANEYYCQLCKTKVVNIVCLREHESGKKHKKAVDQLLKSGGEVPPPLSAASQSVESTSTTDKVSTVGDGTVQVLDGKKLFCTACIIHLANEKDMAMHVKGKKHLRLR